MPAGGEWVDLAPLETPVLPSLPRRARGHGPWSEATRRLWRAWRADPSTGQYTPADIAYALDTIRLAEECHRQPTAALSGEVRVRMDGLGLTPKGRRNLRWRAVAEVGGQAQIESIAAGRSAERRARLREAPTLGAIRPEWSL